MRKIAGYFKQRDMDLRAYGPQVVCDVAGGCSASYSDEVASLAGGESAESGSDGKSDGSSRRVCVFSGAILNNVELWEAYGNGVVGSDASLCLLLYAKLGEGFASVLSGPFMIVIYDSVVRRMWLYRDALGQSRVYYSLLNHGHVLFSNDLRTLLRLPGSSSCLDLKAVSDYLSLGYVPSPGTIYRNVKELEPGGSLSLRFGGGLPVLWRYWRPHFEPKASMGMSSAVSECWDLLDRAVRRCVRRMPGCGVLLSGGIDSNLVLALGSTCEDGVTTSYTACFNDSAYDERELARASSEHFGIGNVQGEVVPGDLGELGALQRHLGEPFGNASLIATTVAMGLAAGQVPGVLTGSGGDELFGGYRRYQAMCVRSLMRLAPGCFWRGMGGLLTSILRERPDGRARGATLRRFGEFMRRDPLAGYGSFQEIFSDELKCELLGDSRLRSQWSYLDDWGRRLEAFGTSRRFVEHFNELDVWWYLPDDGCRKEWIAGVHTGVEHLSPLLDKDVVEFGLSLPSGLRTTLFGRKRVLSELGRQLLPVCLHRQPKRGFGLPISRWFRDESSELLYDMAESVHEWDVHGWLNGNAVSRLVREHVSGVRDHGARLWTLLCLRTWLLSV